MEQGISNNGVLEINIIFDEETGEPHLDKTWQEIYDANINIINIPSSGPGGKISYIPTHSIIISIGRNPEDYFVSAFMGTEIGVFNAATPNDYPVYQENNAQSML